MSVELAFLAAVEISNIVSMKGSKRPRRNIVSSAAMEPTERNLNFQISEEADGAHTFSLRGVITSNGTEIGSLSGHLINRAQCSGFFGTVCDEISKECNDIFDDFFNDDGKVKGPLARRVSAQCHTGGFLSVERVEVDAAYRGQGLGLTLFQRLLEFVQGRWTIAIICPFPLRAEGDEFYSGITGISQHFSRLGFLQCSTRDTSDEVKYWFLDAATYTGTLISKAESKSVVVALPKRPRVRSDVMNQILEVITRVSDPSTNAYAPPFDRAAFIESVRAIMEPGGGCGGGKLNATLALQSAVANKKNMLIEPLLELGMAFLSITIK